MPFDKPYVFLKNNHIVIRGPNGKHIRVNPKNESDADPHGGKGKFAQWHVEIKNGHYQFRNHHSGKYLRIKGNNDIDVGGAGGPLCKFKAHGKGNDRKLESVKFSGKYIAVRDGKVVFGKGGIFLIRGPNGKHLRVNPKHEHEADPHGGKGKFAQWHVEIKNGHFQFRNHHTGKYLRIKGNNDIDVGGSGGPLCKFKAHGHGHERKLESVKFHGKYIAVRNGKVVFGTGGPFCKLHFFRD